MPSSVRALYVAALLILVIAGGVLNARTTLPTGAPVGCADVPAGLVTDLFPGATVESTEGTPRPDGDQLLQLKDGDEDTLLELRCERIGSTRAQMLADRYAELDTEVEDESLARRLDVDGTDPVRHQRRSLGDLLEQPDTEAGLLRTWYVSGERADDELVQVVERTLAHQDGRAAETGDGF